MLDADRMTFASALTNGNKDIKRQWKFL